jgi:hypothetical protein
LISLRLGHTAKAINPMTGVFMRRWRFGHNTDTHRVKIAMRQRDKLEQCN